MADEKKKDVFKNKRKRRTFTDASRYYIDKEEYGKEMMEYKRTGKASERLGELFMIHAQRCASAANFKGYTYRGDMESTALLHLLKYSHVNYDPNKGKDAFSYCTSIIHHAFLQVIAKEKKQSTIKDALIKNQDKNNNRLTLNIIDDQQKE
jgi:hypothetical protein